MDYITYLVSYMVYYTAMAGMAFMGIVYMYNWLVKHKDELDEE